MRRHGWALCIGLLASGSAVAQPPARGERHPPPLELPGVVVGQTPGSRSVAATDQFISQRLSSDPTSPAPVIKIEPAPRHPTATTTIAPIEPAGPVDPGPAHFPGTPVGTLPPPGCATPAPASKCGIADGNYLEWLTFRSRAGQSGHYVPPYRPPLYTWFPCDPKRTVCGPQVMAVPGCGTSAGACPIGPSPTSELPGPASHPPVVGLPTCPDKEALTSFEKVGDGLGFTPGGAPMAGPTTQVKPSKWRPR